MQQFLIQLPVSGLERCTYPSFTPDHSKENADLTEEQYLDSGQ